MPISLSQVVRKHIPRKGPEWGSGGIFGLKYYEGTLYYTLAFEAEAHFIGEEGEKVYEFELVGDRPTSGGDTYNAVEAVDGKIYFGGWVHAPAIYVGKRGKESRISFVNKFSHLHEYDVENSEVSLLWKEGIGDERRWAGEISNILYDPYEDSLLLSRLDGHENLGVYEFDLEKREMMRISEKPSLKGAILNEYACFDHSTSFLSLEKGLGILSVQFFDMIERKFEEYEVSKAFRISVDEDEIFAPLPGCMASAYSRLFVFCRGSLLVGNPKIGEDFTSIRLLDFLSGYSPQRTMAIPYMGGILVAYNAFTHGIISEERDAIWSYLNEIFCPSLLLYISPPTVRIVGAFGARITSMEEFEGGILIGWGTMANVGEKSVTPFDTGYRGISYLPNSQIFSDPPPFQILLPGERISGLTFGGIPLSGYREPRIKLISGKENSIRVNEYFLSLPPYLASSEEYHLLPGETIDLSSYSGIVSFRLEKEDPKAKLLIDLRRCTMPYYKWIVKGELAVSPIPLPEEFEEYSKVFSSVVILPESEELDRRRYDPRAWGIFSVNWLHEPVPDFTSPRLSQLLRILKWIEERRKEGPVLVHCIGGVGRSGTVAACYFVYRGRSPEEALREVRKKIPDAATSPDQEKMPYLLEAFLRLFDRKEREEFLEKEKRARYPKSFSRVCEMSMEISLPILEEEMVRESFMASEDLYLRKESGNSESYEGIPGGVAELSYSLDMFHTQDVRRVDVLRGNPLKILAYSPLEVNEILEEAKRKKEILEGELGKRIEVERYWPWP